MKRIDADLSEHVPAAVTVPSRTIPLKSLSLFESPEARAMRAIPFGRRRGPLTVGPRAPVGIHRKFLLMCDCGHSGWYEAVEIVSLLDQGKGCQSEKCSAIGYREAVWVEEPTVSRKLQLYTLLLLKGEEVQSWWGGTLDDTHELTFAEAYENFSAYVQTRGVRRGGPWIRRLDPELPFLEGNVILSKKPDPVFVHMRDGALDVDGQRMKVRELCALTGLSPADLMLKIFKIGTCDDLIFNLMSEE